jgi:hypothetical protein
MVFRPFAPDIDGRATDMPWSGDEMSRRRELAAHAGATFLSIAA